MAVPTRRGWLLVLALATACSASPMAEESSSPAPDCHGAPKPDRSSCSRPSPQAARWSAQVWCAWLTATRSGC